MPHTVRHRSRGTANAVMTVVGEFLRFGTVHGWVPPETTELLTQPELLRFTPPAYDTGERGQHRQIQATAFRFKTAQAGYQDLSPAQADVESGTTPGKHVVLLDD
ncbi:hypothetical protein [Streptomyces sp. NBC_00140]|uniref:hypothetical protein n=1 Tax=Streptomyces sp. NBC_00140 TaxID=2975664 RepID=UPI0022528A37|nr:hypothetical protein [Streptomyces sp. NBC_00140]MCX5328188.1 hypothetical protein [Streptomyces sp. NBC_00140]